MELYAKYIKEREGKECLYNDDCFIIYKIYDDSVSVIDIYSSPKVRGTGVMLEFCKDFYEKMWKQGVKTAYGYTDESTEGWEHSEKLMLKFGFKHIKKNGNYNNYILNIEEII